RKHYKDTGGILGGGPTRKKAEEARLEDMRDRPGVIVVDGKGGNRKAEVAGGNDRSSDPKAAKQPDAKDIAQLDPRKIWQEALWKGLENPGLVVAAADFLFDEELYEHAAEFLKANLRAGIIVQPWVYEALAIALEFSHAQPEEVLRARLSALSL